MSERLVYHTPESMAGGVSPFDEALLELAPGADLRLACPYLDTRYLRRLTDRAACWRLVTDVEAWLASHTAGARRRVLDCLATHPHHIRHYPGLHAKVVLGRAALVGSANLTRRGIRGRVEMGVLLVEPEQLAELGEWYEAVWSAAGPVPLDEAERFAAELPSEPRTPSTPLPSSAPTVQASLRRGPFDTAATEQAVVERCRLMLSRQWAEGFFALAGRMVEATGLAADDPRLSVTMPNAHLLSVQIGRRPVLVALKRSSTQRSGGLLEVMLPGGWLKRATRHPGYRAYRRCWPFATPAGQDGAPVQAEYETDDPSGLREALVTAWMRACRTECDRSEGSNQRRYHQPPLYRLLTDTAHRSAVLGKAFKPG